MCEWGEAFQGRTRDSAAHFALQDGAHGSSQTKRGWLFHPAMRPYSGRLACKGWCITSPMKGASPPRARR
jgi:hypothetical protein